jgi:hypothetical protein
MFGYFDDGPRTWKWAVPAAIFVALIPVTGRMFASPNAEMQYWASLPCGFGLLFLAIALVNLWRLATAHNEEMFKEHQSALSMTPLVLLSENLKQMHPEAVRVLNRFGVRTSWQVRVDANRGTRDWVLADSNVHFGFIEFVLARSGAALYPKNRFSDGSKKWDPDGIVEDREQYDELEKWMFARMMVTRSHGDYKPAEFIPPWMPDLILETMGLTGEQDLYRPDDDLKVKDLTQPPAPSLQGKGGAVPVNGNNGQHEERGLTDEEWESNKKENTAYAEKYQS